MRDSVLLGVDLWGEGEVEGSVLVGTRAGRIDARRAFDVQSTVAELSLPPRSGAYRVVSAVPVRLNPGERITTVFLRDREGLLRVREDTNLRDLARHYERPILGNVVSFRDAHRDVLELSAEEVEERRRRAEEAVLRERPA